MRSPLLLLLALFLTFSAIESYAQIPGIQQQPQWAMPFFFEDANGDKDTVWIGYDPDASVHPDGYDSIYNEWQAIDTSKFNVILCPTCYSPFLTTPPDSAWKISIQSYYFPTASIGFINGKMPITMKWVDSLFYSDSLPYPAQSNPAWPKARADVMCSSGEPGYITCPWDAFLILTDSTYPVLKGGYPVFDSLFFDGSGNLPPSKAIAMNIYIVPLHHDPGIGIDDPKEANQVQIYPNPVHEEITICNNDQTSPGMYITITNMAGMIVFQEYSGKTTSINPVLAPGVYIITIRTGSNRIIKKLIKQ